MVDAAPLGVAPPYLVVIGGSAGAIEALRPVLSKLHPGVHAAFLVAIHIPPVGGALVRVLSHGSKLPVELATDGEPIVPGCVLVAPPDHHLLALDGCVRLSRTVRENGFRPAIDPLFRSAARSAGPRVIGVILSGLLDDGAAGLRSVQRHGGTTIVQDFDDATFPDLPRAAARQVKVDYALPAHAIAPAIERLAEAGAPRVTAPPPLAGEPEGQDYFALQRTEVTCPECGGVLATDGSSSAQRFSCHVGHSYSAESLLSGQRDALERALWSALRTLEERAFLLVRMAERARDAGLDALAERYDARATVAEERVAAIRKVVVDEPPV